MTDRKLKIVLRGNDLKLARASHVGGTTAKTVGPGHGFLHVYFYLVLLVYRFHNDLQPFMKPQNEYILYVSES